MAYKIQYNPEFNGKYPEKTKHKRSWMITVFTLVLVVLLLATYKDSFRTLLRPGDGQAASEAVSAFLEEIHEGESFREAATAFCRQILYDETP